MFWKSFSVGGPVVLLLALGSGCGSEQRMAQQGPGGSGASPAPRSVSGVAPISDEDLAERGLMSLWTKGPTVQEGPIRSAYLLPEGLFAVTRPDPERRAWRLVRYDVETGLARWFYDLDEPLEYPPAAYRYGPSPEGPRSDELFILQKDVLRCLDLQHGMEMWRADLSFPVSCGPRADETQVYIGSYNGRIYALAKKKNLESWSYITGGEIRSTGAFGSSGEVYFTSSDKYIYRLQPNNGWVPGKSWRFATGGRILGSPVFFSNWVFVGSTDFKLFCFEVDGAGKWEFPAESPILETPVVMSFRPDKPLAICISQDDRRRSATRTAWAVDVKTGQKVWHRDHVQQVVGVGRKAIYLLPDNRPDRAGGPRRLAAVDAIKGDLIFELPVEGFDFIPTNDADHGMNQKARGIVYLVSKTGLIQAIREKP